MVSVFSISLCRCLILVKPQAFINGSERFCDKVSEGVCLYLQAIRPKKKKIVLPPEISWVKIFLLPTRPHKSNVYENIYFLFQRNRHTNKKISTCKFICTILRFFHSNNKRQGSLFFNKKKSCQKLFKCKRYLKNSIKLINFFFAAAQVKIFCVTRISGNKSIIFFGLTWVFFW